MLFKVCVRYYKKKWHTDTHKQTKGLAQKETDFYQHGSPLICHAPIQHDQTVLKTSLKPQAILLRSSHSFVWPPKNTLKENKHKSCSRKMTTACFDWALQRDKQYLTALTTSFTIVLETVPEHGLHIAHKFFLGAVLTSIQLLLHARDVHRGLKHNKPSSYSKHSGAYEAA